MFFRSLTERIRLLKMIDDILGAKRAGGAKQVFRSLKRLLIGAPLPNKSLIREKLPVYKALAIFSSDALSSVAYGPEQIILVLVAAGTALYGFAAPVALAILALLAVVAVSYAQVARANPGGGGSYSVAKKKSGGNGRPPGRRFPVYRLYAYRRGEHFFRYGRADFRLSGPFSLPHGH